MLTEVKNNIKFLLISLKYNLKSSLEYKTSFLIQSIFMIINNGFFLIFWLLVFHVNDGDVNGLEMNDILFIWALSSASWGIANFLFGGLREINRYVLTGGLDTYLLQPKNILLSIATSKCDFSACGDLVYGLVIGYIACKGNLGICIKLLGYILIGTIVTCAVFIFIRTLVIWIGEVEQIAHIYENSLFITFGTYPYEIFGGVTKFLMFTIVPAVYVSHLPLKLLKNFDIKLFLLLIVISIFLLGFSSFVFYKSLKKYESGNNIAMKE